MGSSAGGAFLPGDPPPSTGQALTNPTISGPTMTGTMTGTYTIGGTVTITGATISGGTVTSTGSTLTAPTITAPVISGAATVASGATITTPTLPITTALLTATGSTGGNGGVMPTVYPAAVIITGATGSGVDLLTGPVGQLFYLQNLAAASMRIYCVGGTINGTTGTTAYVITNTGNKAAIAVLTSATGAWFIGGNT